MGSAQSSAGVSIGAAIVGGILAPFTAGTSLPFAMGVSTVAGANAVVQSANGNHGKSGDFADGLIMGATKIAEKNVP